MAKREQREKCVTLTSQQKYNCALTFCQKNVVSKVCYHSSIHPTPQFPISPFSTLFLLYPIDKSQFTTTFKPNLPYNPSNDTPHEEAVGGRGARAVRQG